MWVPGSLAFLAPVFFIGIRLLFGGSQRRVSTSLTLRVDIPVTPTRSVSEGRFALPMVSAGIGSGEVANSGWSDNDCHRSSLITHHQPLSTHSSFDVFRLPLMGRVLRW